MSYTRKTKDEYIIMTNYGYGWEEEVTEETYLAAKQTKREYLENACSLIDIKIVKRRVKV